MPLVTGRGEQAVRASDRAAQRAVPRAAEEEDPSDCIKNEKLEPKSRLLAYIARKVNLAPFVIFFFASLCRDLSPFKNGEVLEVHFSRPLNRKGGYIERDN